MDFGAVLSRAWQIVWKHKVLWIFGILAGCSGNLGNFSSGRNQSQEEFGNIPNWFQQFSNTEIAIMIGVAVLILLVLIVLFTFLGTIGRIGLVRGTVLAEQGAERLSFGELFRGSLPYFWRVFGLNLLVALVIGFLVLLITIPLILVAVVTFGIALFCIIPLLCILVPLGWLLGVVLQQANIALIVDDLSIQAAVQRGWEVFRNNLGTMAVMALILMVGVGIVGGLILMLPLGLVALPALTGVAAGGERAMMGGFIIAGLCLVAYLPVMLIVSGLLRSFIEAAWTLTYLRLRPGPVVTTGFVQAPDSPYDSYAATAPVDPVEGKEDVASTVVTEEPEEPIPPAI